MENTVRNVGCEWLRSKQEKHGIIADLTGFDNLKAMLGAEDITRRRKGTLKTKKRKNYGYFQFQAQEDMPVVMILYSTNTYFFSTYESCTPRESDYQCSAAEMSPADSFIGKETELKLIEIENVNVAKVKGREATVVEGEKALTVDCTVNSAGLAISCSGTAEMVQVECSATKETEQKRIEKENVDTMVEMTQASATTNGVNSSIAIGVSLSSLEGNISFCRGVAETVPVETLTVNAMKQKRKVDRASKEMQEDTAKGMEREQVEFTDNIVLRQLLVTHPPTFSGDQGTLMVLHTIVGRCAPIVAKKVIRYANARCGSGKRRNYASFVGVWITLRGVVERIDTALFAKEEATEPDTVQKGTKKDQVMVFAYNAEIQGMICFHVQLTICPVISRSFGHLCCADFPDIDPREVYCYNCGNRDHATEKLTLHATNVERKAILQEIAVSKGRVDREENKRAISFCFKDLTENEKVHGIF
ncbi:hypothetical protein POTOM_051547 [Populus tomentosa]|uniref:Uncharacterized protein n=1 Tax=Populus tomentosa TaxID=118781 RepID=A0A8X8C1B4_POPTO|nr:hypothetical protein POTOM_051547 [Populus tomentosa]